MDITKLNDLIGRLFSIFMESPIWIKIAVTILVLACYGICLTGGCRRQLDNKNTGILLSKNTWFFRLLG